MGEMFDAATTWVGGFFTSSGASAVVVDIIGGAVIGAATGAVVAAVTDGDIGKAAIYGAIAGGVAGGLNSSNGAPTGEAINKVPYVDSGDIQGGMLNAASNTGGGAPVQPIVQNTGTPGIEPALTRGDYWKGQAIGGAAKGGLDYLAAGASADASKETMQQKITADKDAATVAYERGKTNYEGVAPITSGTAGGKAVAQGQPTGQPTPRMNFIQNLDAMRAALDTMPTAPSVPGVGLLLGGTA